MAEKNNATCAICGRPYHICLSCKSETNLSPWKIHCDTSEHYKVFMIVKGLSTGLYTKAEARDKFKNIDLRDIDSFRPHIKQIVEDAMKDESFKKKNKKVATNVVESTVVEEESVVEAIEETIIEMIDNSVVETTEE